MKKLFKILIILLIPFTITLASESEWDKLEEVKRQKFEINNFYYNVFISIDKDAAFQLFYYDYSDFRKTIINITKDYLIFFNGGNDLNSLEVAYDIYSRKNQKFIKNINFTKILNLDFEYEEFNKYFKKNR